MPTIGEQLKQARLARKLTIKQAGQATRLRPHYLQAMEEDDFSAMPSAAQARGFLRLYVEFLGLDVEAMISQFRTETNSEPATPPPPNLPPPPVPKPRVRPVPPPAQTDEEPGIASPTLPPGPSQNVFNEIGATLRSRRELISLTLEEVERHTRVRKHNLEMIEAGEFDRLPSPVQLRGILSAYASFLDLDSDELLLRYADAIQMRRVERQGGNSQKPSSRKVRIALPFWIGRFISPDLVFGGTMIILLLGLSIWAAERILSTESGQAAATATPGPSISDVLLASPEVSPTSGDAVPTSSLQDGVLAPEIQEIQVTLTETPLSAIFSGIQLTVVVTERTFLRVIVDGEIKQDGRPAPGSALNFEGSEKIEVLTGSGSAIQIIFNQNNLGVMGNFGEIVNRIYTVNGIETPTPTVSPTPSITPKPSITARPSSTLRPSVTPRPTSSIR